MSYIIRIVVHSRQENGLVETAVLLPGRVFKVTGVISLVSTAWYSFTLGNTGVVCSSWILIVMVHVQTLSNIFSSRKQKMYCTC